MADANRLVNVMKSCAGGNAIVIGGGYIGMECAASLVINKINVTMAFPEAHCSKHLTFKSSFLLSNQNKCVRRLHVLTQWCLSFFFFLLYPKNCKTSMLIF